MKYCKKCKTEKPLQEFIISRNRKDGCHPYCKKCEKRLGLDDYSKNKAIYLKRAADRRVIILSMINEIKSAGCSRCGEKRIACIDFHHVAGKDKNISQLMTSSVV